MKRFIILLFSVFFLCGCQKKLISQTDFVLDTVVKIMVYDTDKTDKEKEEIISEAISLCRDYEKVFSKTIASSDVGRINNNPKEGEEVSWDTVRLVEKSLYYSDLTGGRFDITIAPVTELWDFKSGEANVPRDEDIQAALELVGYENVSAYGNRVVIDKEGAKIDFGGIAKGYIADKVAEFLKEKGVKAAIIDLGGNITCVGKNTNGNMFKVGVQKPFSDTGELAAVIECEDISVVTSGIYQRYFEKDGKIYHHILDTSTGYPVDNELNSVTIITKNAADADALSTSCLILGLDEGLKLIESTEDCEAVFITKDNEVVLTSGMGDKINYTLN